jgi:plasmid stabilization system protein ParE
MLDLEAIKGRWENKEKSFCDMCLDFVPALIEEVERLRGETEIGKALCDLLVKEKMHWGYCPTECVTNLINERDDAESQCDGYLRAHENVLKELKQVTAERDACREREHIVTSQAGQAVEAANKNAERLREEVKTLSAGRQYWSKGNKEAHAEAQRLRTALANLLGNIRMWEEAHEIHLPWSLEEEVKKAEKSLKPTDTRTEYLKEIEKMATESTLIDIKPTEEG